MSKKKFIIIVLIIFIIIKVIQISFIKKIKINIDNFEKLNNSYCMQILNTQNDKIEIIRKVKNNIIQEKTKLVYLNKEDIIFIDNDNNKEIIIDLKDNTYKIKDNKEDVEIQNLPSDIEIPDEAIRNLKEGNIFAILYYFKILYIVPTKYNNIDCYKVRTTREILYVDKENLYPVYLEYKQNNSVKEKEKVTVEYVFEENILTDEDIKIPDLTNYTLTQN